MRITISFKHREDFERTKRLIRKADKYEQEGRKLGDPGIGIIHSALMRSDVYVPIDAENGFGGELLHRGVDAKVSSQLYQEGWCIKEQ